MILDWLNLLVSVKQDGSVPKVHTWHSHHCLHTNLVTLLEENAQWDITVKQAHCIPHLALGVQLVNKISVWMLLGVNPVPLDTTATNLASH